MTVIVRALRPEDAAAFARVRRAALPAMLATAESVAFDLAHAHPDARYRPLVAEADGEVVGTAQVGIAYDSPDPGQGYVNVYVDPGRTGLGAGSLIVRAAEEYLAGRAPSPSIRGCWTPRGTGRSPRAAATGRAGRPTSSAWIWRTARCRRSPRRRPG